jgi:hypothetical protein
MIPSLIAVIVAQAIAVTALLIRNIRLRRRLGPARLPWRSGVTPRMVALAEVAKHRKPSQGDAENLLPPINVDLEAAFDTRIPASAAPQQREDRREFAAHRAALRHRLEGRREIEFINALAISYLRRRTPHTPHARRLFFRIWDEVGTALIEEMNTRWLISTLMTFADHGRTEDERLCGSLGYIYGAFVVSSETERAYWAEGTKPEITSSAADTAAFGLNGASPFELGSSDHLSNLNGFVYEHALRSPVAGPILEKLMMRVRYSDTFFSRLDHARLAQGLGNDEAIRDRFWAFGTAPDAKGKTS